MAFSFQTPQQPQSSLFQTPQQPQPSTFFQTPQLQQQPSPFQLTSPSPAPPSFQFQPQQQQPQQVVGGQAQGQQQYMIYTKDKAPASYGTKFEDLHPDSQKFLQLIEDRIRDYKDESERLDQCSRLYDLTAYGSFELDASRIIQELGVITTAAEREKVSIQELTNNVKKMMWDAEFSIRSYMMLRPRFLRLNSTSNVTPGTQSAGAIVASGQNSQLGLSSTPTFDFYSGLPKRPSLFMQNTVSRFEKYLSECRQWVEEVEQLLKADADKASSNCLEALPKVLSNVHDYFIHVAAKVESLHQYVESMKTAYLADQRRRGDGNDPFLEANRREVAKKEAAARRVHPTLHLPAISAQPTTQVAGIFASSAAPAASTPQQPAGSSAAPSSSGFSMFNTPSSATAASSSSLLFSTPAGSAPSSSLFSTPQSTTFGNPSTSLFGQTQSVPVLSSAPSFGSTPAMGGSSLFSTPPGTLTGSGASFGPSKSSKPKARTSRR